MLRGELVPDPIVLEVVGRWIESRARAFLLDGFPRTLAQADALDRFLKTRALPLEIVFALEIDEATGAERMRRRLICAGCRKSVNIGHHVPDGRAPCPYCGGTLVHRPDDRDDVFARRMDVYRRDTRPVLDHYAQRGILRRLEAGRPAEPLALDAVRLLEETS